MGLSLRSGRSLPGLFWALTTLAILIWSMVPGYTVGWDLEVYRNAAHALRLGHDPYVDGMAVQEVYHRTKALHPNDPPPYTYVYSPITLPVLQAANHLPHWLTLGVYWILYFAAIAVVIRVAWEMVEPGERRLFALAAPAAVFFPGLLQQDCFFSGNIAYLLYAAVFTLALRGWKTGSWEPFYVGVLLASLCKAPLLSLLAIPVFSARGQWLRTALTGTLGVLLFALQPQVWPTLFRNYLRAVELQFSYNHDFSSSPAGLLADCLYYRVPYQVTSAVFYGCYALIVAWALFVLSRRFLAGLLKLEQFVPVLLVGVILLNPRIMEYDVAPITMFMALVMRRVFAALWPPKLALAAFFGTLTVINLLAAAENWRMTECFTLAGVFAAGVWTLTTTTRRGELPSRPAGERSSNEVAEAYLTA